MANYNYAITKMPCMRCGNRNEFEVSIYFGKTTMAQVEMGQPYPLAPGSQHLDATAEAYTECSNCGLDFNLTAVIEKGVLVRLEPDLENLPYIPDERTTGDITCPRCESAEAVVSKFKGNFSRYTIHCKQCRYFSTERL